MNIRRLLRLSSVAALVAITSVLTACSDATGPSARRSGYITSAAAQASGAVVAPSGTSSTGTTTKTGTVAKPDSSVTNNSGYNVTAF